jgi:hypothetical protein
VHSDDATYGNERSSVVRMAYRDGKTRGRETDTVSWVRGGVGGGVRSGFEQFLGQASTGEIIPLMGLTTPTLISLASEMRRQKVPVILFEPFYDLTNPGEGSN